MEQLEIIWQQILGMQWSDYLDILVVAFLVYKILPLLKSPGSAKITRAVIIVLVVSWLTGFLKLHTMSFILNQFLAIGLLALVILFQPELRRMLDKLGNVKLSAMFRSLQQDTGMGRAITQTVKACEIMGHQKVGALIVFARNHRLDEYFKTGTTIDGEVSEQLIRNIFFTNAALHDGAMIIRDGRIAAAGCVLPLSDSERLSLDLGTRHRAAVGMSEVSDAVVVVVSEETGAISVAMGGMLKRHLAPQTLERLLRRELCPEEEETQEETLAVKLRQKFHKQKEDQNEEK